jgi:TonB-linked SusC/RagA family outer membrane protein
MRKRSLFLVLLLFSITTSLFAQKKEITGKVIDATTSEPIGGATVTSDKKNNTITKTDGTFSIKVDASAKILIISSVGYTAQSIELNDQKVIDVKMQAASNALEDVVVIGYGTQRKSHLTGAISKYKNENLDQTPNSRLDQALQGKIAGVQVQNISSEAGSDPKINIRGISSISANASPFIVVDGQPVPDLSFVNMGDVESIEVLKDAASAAIYGSRGANGVIMITTKSGKTDRPRYNFKASTGFKEAYKIYPMMSVTEYANLLFYEASLKAKDPSITPPTGTGIIANNERAMYVIENTLLGGQPTNWQDEALRTANVQNIQLSISGGSKGFKYFVSGGYQKDQGMMYHSEYDKYSMRSKFDAQLSKRTKLTININPSYIKRERPSVNYIDFVRFYSYLPVYHTEATAAFVNQAAQWASIKPGDFAQARHFNGRVYSGLMPDGSTWVNTSAVDPFNTANNTPKSIMETRTITANDYRVVSSGELTVNIAKGLDFKTLASAYISYTDALDFTKRNSAKDGDLNKGQYNNRLYLDLLSENTFTYNKKIRDHSFNVLAGYTAERFRTINEQAIGQDYPSDNITTLNTALQVIAPSIDANGNLQGTYTQKSRAGILSYLGRVIYDYKSKYLLSASFRRDGTSYFAPGHKWGNFPAVSLGWVASQEEFMKSVTWINNLKLRGSYGVSGNNRLPVEYPFVDLLYAANYSLGSGTGTPNAGQALSGTILSNSDITWERTFQFNFGIDISLFRNAIMLSVDKYHSKTQALLLRQNVMAFTGVQQTWNNIGRLQNDGMEFELTTNNIRKRNFKWTTTANLSHNKNKLIELGGEAFFLNQGERTELYQNKPGDPLIQYFGFKTDGVWLSQAQIDTAKAHGLTSGLSNIFVAGGLKLVDLDGNDTLDNRDRTVIGQPYPKFTWGINNTVSYKSFDLSFFLQGTQGGQLINGDPNYNETKRINKSYTKNRWLSPNNPGDGKTPYSTNGFNWMLTDYVVEDASYWALREIIVGYTLPQKIAKKVGLSSTRFYFSAQNLYFHTAEGYRGINPEARFTSGPYSIPGVDGYQRGSFPMPKTYMFGIDLNF